MLNKRHFDTSQCQSVTSLIRLQFVRLMGPTFSPWKSLEGKKSVTLLKKVSLGQKSIISRERRDFAKKGISKIVVEKISLLVNWRFLAK